MSRQRLIVIPNGVSGTGKVKRSNKPYNKNISKRFSVVVVGRLIKRKAVLELVQHLIADQRATEHFKFQIVGDGPEFHKLQEVIQSCAASENFVLHGQLQSPAVIEIFQKADILISNSYSEGLSNALLEGLMAGCIPLLRDIPENREIVEVLGDKFLFSNLDEMFIKLLLIRELIGSKLHQDIEQLVDQSFTFAKVAESYKALYQRTLIRG